MKTIIVLAIYKGYRFIKSFYRCVLLVEYQQKRREQNRVKLQVQVILYLSEHLRNMFGHVSRMLIYGSISASNSYFTGYDTIYLPLSHSQGKR